MKDLVKTAIVTGGARGIGRAITLALAKEGWQVFFVDVRLDEDADTLCEEAKSFGGVVKGFQLDVSNKEEVESFFKEHIKDKVYLDVLVNNAGITKDALIIRMKDQDWKKVLEVNLDGTFYCMQQASKIMVRQRGGKIINIASVVALSGNPGQANYCASKAGIIGLTKSAALELAPRGITVNAVAPGFIETDMTEKLPEDVKKDYLSRIPLGRPGTPEDVANVVVWLASDKASYVTGQVIGVNGGMYL